MAKRSSSSGFSHEELTGTNIEALLWLSCHIELL
eukprot:CAMPEP_0175856216 /NCGR_PEP_ID=MMETSP0107_2-20121207/28370_1 /TAXON_ID=195067 ORGANISM="Goniomonas pacifica, Strain CCMP1869" /NCGR_SAMPLE_ID=MMETSP0107_2 /ASSEMBLY_ACC=CAM_ASM_000203 /LENGTH=33 /DNA_ID= /DNA_START= /DNA_END= /DNA_ORIENTATION=